MQANTDPVVLVPTSPLTWHTATVGTHVWARKVLCGEWYPAVVVGVGRKVAKVCFESGRRSEQFYSEVILRNPNKRGADKPARAQTP